MGKQTNVYTINWLTRIGDSSIHCVAFLFCFCFILYLCFSLFVLNFIWRDPFSFYNHRQCYLPHQICTSWIPYSIDIAHTSNLFRSKQSHISKKIFPIIWLLNTHKPQDFNVYMLWFQLIVVVFHQSILKLIAKHLKWFTNPIAIIWAIRKIQNSWNRRMNKFIWLLSQTRIATNIHKRLKDWLS